MAFRVEDLNESHLPRILDLWNLDSPSVYPFEPLKALIPGDAFGLGKAANGAVRLQGAFDGDRLAAAIKWERRTTDAAVGELGNLFPGDGLIHWLLFDQDPAAEELLKQALPALGNRVYAFPEFSDWARYSLFGTGMLSLGRQRIADFLDRRGFRLPVGEQWGPQERICFHLALQGPRAVAPLPGGFTARFVQDPAATVLVLVHGADCQVGASRVSPLRFAGREVPRAVCVSWLGVGEPWRGRGLGETLLQMQLEHARLSGSRNVYLTTHSGRPAWRLYRKLGFNEVDRACSYVRNLKP